MICLAAVLTALLLVFAPSSASASPSTGNALVDFNRPANSITSYPDTIVVFDSDWADTSLASDCFTGQSDDVWKLVLVHGRKVTITVDDILCPGDFYEVRVNGSLLGTTPNLAPPWGCIYGDNGPWSSATFDTILPGGTHFIRIRDAGFDGHPQEELANQHMCPAGFLIQGTVDPIPGSCGSPPFVMTSPTTIGASDLARPIHERAVRAL